MSACYPRSKFVTRRRYMMMGARQTTAVIITFIKSNKNSVERRAGAYRSRKKKHIYICIYMC
jgi:hypothetical protein